MRALYAQRKTWHGCWLLWRWLRHAAARGVTFGPSWPGGRRGVLEIRSG